MTASTARAVAEVEAEINAPPPELASSGNWVGWKYGKKRPNGKREKVPVNPHTGRRASVDNPETWGSYEQALDAAERYGLEGAGVVFSTDNDFCGSDIDDCHDPKTDRIEPWAQEIIEAFDSYTEVSPSGTGVKIFARGKLPGDRHVCNDLPGKVEMYDKKRFFTFTGQRVWGKGVENRQTEIADLYERLFPHEGAEEQEDDRGAVLRVDPGFQGDDAALLAMLRNARDGEKFSQVFERGSLQYHGEDPSRADLYLMGKFARATGSDPEQMERLFDGSALARRDKWTKRADYRKCTIAAAIRGNARRIPPDGRNPHNKHAAHKHLEALERWASEYHWSGKGGARNRHLLGAFLNTGGGHGRLIREGGVEYVEFYAASRDLMPEAGIASFDSFSAGVEDLKALGILECVHEGTRKAAPTYRLKGAAHCPSTNTPYPPCVVCARGTRRVLRLLRRIREPSPTERRQRSRDGGKRRVTTVRDLSRGALIQKVGKERALVLEKIYLAGRDGINYRVLAQWLRKRPNDLVRRHLPYLLELGLVVEIGEGVYAIPEDFEYRLDEVLTETGCKEAERLQLEGFGRLEKAREFCRERPPDRAPTQAEMDKRREEQRPNDITLSDEELKCLAAIEDWERESGEFDFTQAMSKKLFYKYDQWPTAEQCERLAMYQRRHVAPHIAA